MRRGDEPSGEHPETTPSAAWGCPHGDLEVAPERCEEAEEPVGRKDETPGLEMRNFGLVDPHQPARPAG
jgi:hypothetical protein